MKTGGKSLLVSLLLTAALTIYLNMEKLRGTQEDLKTFEVAAGNIPLTDPTSPDPLVHCYPVASPDELDIKTRMDFEARTSGGWVPAPDEGADGKYCLIETPAQVQKRLAEQHEE